MSFRVVPCNHTLITQQRHIYKHKQSLIPQDYSNAFKAYLVMGCPPLFTKLRKSRPPPELRDIQEKRLVLVQMLTQKLKAVYILWMDFQPLREGEKTNKQMIMFSLIGINQ